jgi:hypothetical protein
MRVCLDTLITITEGTGEPQILFLRWATSSKGNKVLDVHWHTRNELRCVAVAATVVSVCRHSFAYGVGDVRARQGELLLLLLDRHLIAASREEQPSMRPADKQTTILIHEVPETESVVGRQLASILAVKKGT